MAEGKSPTVFPRKWNPFWKPVLILGGSPEFVKHDIAENGNDFVVSGPIQKDLFPHQQDVEGFVKLVERLSEPGQTIVDPFCGTGTTLVAGMVAPSGPR